MDKFSSMIEDVKANIKKKIDNPLELPWYMSIKQLKMTISELDKMNQVRDMRLFMPYYPKGIADSCWDSNDNLGKELLNVLEVYRSEGFMLDTKEIVSSVLKVIDANCVGIIGIDGLGGAGKSTICEKICQDFEENNYHTILLHIDDFINVRAVRYNSAYPDWQCYYDLQWRFDYFSSIINKIKNSNEAYIDIELYDKDNDTYFLQRFEIYENTIVIVEGVFLQRKEYCNIFDYIIYLDIPEEIRLQRVLKRDTYIGNEQQIIDKYRNRYFPAEHRYIKEYQPQKNADFVIGE